MAELYRYIPHIHIVDQLAISKLQYSILRNQLSKPPHLLLPH